MLIVTDYNVIIADKPGKPDAPEIGKTTKTSVALSWKPPSSDGGAPITNYVVEYRVEGGFKWVRANVEEVSDTRLVTET